MGRELDLRKDLPWEEVGLLDEAGCRVGMGPGGGEEEGEGGFWSWCGSPELTPGTAEGLRWALR